MDELENQEFPVETEHTQEPVIPEQPPVAAQPEQDIPAAEAAVEQPVAPKPRRRSPYENAPYMMAHQPAAPAERPVKEKKKKKKGRGFLRFVAAVTLIAATAVATGFYCESRSALQMAAMQQQIDVLRQELKAQNQTTPGTSISGTPNVNLNGGLTPAEVYVQNQQSVVLIQTDIATGSGFILSEDGYVVTNYHVIEGGSAISVVLYDNSSYRANLVGYEANNDLALLQINAPDLRPVTLGSSDDLIVGDQVAAIGNPLGELTATLTVGYVSAKERDVSTDSATINMIQTDCAINSGNSGGPLFNMKGEVVGITSAKYSGMSASGASIEGIGFAIPMDDVVGMLDDLKQFGYVKSGYLGVTVYTVLPNEAEMFGRPLGCLVESVTPGSCAAVAGVRKADVITALGGYQIEGYTDLARALRAFDGGERTTITVDRNGQTLVLEITLDEKPRQTAPAPSGGNMPDSGDYQEWFEYFFGD